MIGATSLRSTLARATLVPALAAAASFGVPTFLGIGATAVHAATACVEVGGDADDGGLPANVETGYCEVGDTSQAALNVDVADAGTPTLPCTAAPACVATGSTLGAAVSAGGVEATAWENGLTALSPQGQLVVWSAATGCVGVSSDNAAC